ncbi:MAG: glutamate-5-semialdehyde dehydrogenase [Planctomycetota bacterium]|nr:glutamate-5-semialdehyde dehydrogenase [Planctomycetota bacterium]
MNDLETYVRQVSRDARTASQLLTTASGATKNAWLKRTAELLRARQSQLIDANQQDITRADEFGLSAAMIDRLRLTPERIEAIAAAAEEIVMLADPIGEVIDSSVRPNGLNVRRIRVPMGVVFFIYESRPNVTVDAAALCVKSGNAVILRGGKEAFHSNHALHALLTEALTDVGLPPTAVQLVNTTDRDAVGYFLAQSGLIDVAIPRGGKSLIERVSAEATMPVIKHFDGICHVYVDRGADFDMGERIIVNSKCQRTGVCNTAESLLVDAAIADRFLPRVSKALQEQGVELRCCERSQPLMPGSIRATEQDFATEYLDLILSVKVVDDVHAAIDHINKYGSHHTDSIVSNDLPATEAFCARVDSAAVMVNASTRFNDGNELGLGAEIGISTDKFHARGPCGLRELTSYKFVVHGNGQLK